ncbi:MAG TPA: hypothetical protein VI793_17785 [Anaerolineales bacterium]|nr:hypothetical protein [Pyrinomonadaceae bacterium]HLE29981.1 hypothetical protein [Anaerolineales bacterium]
MNHGEWTARIARILAGHLQQRNYEVLFDHGRPDSDPADKVGKIASWVGPSYSYEAILGHLDIAIVVPTTNRVAALIEIEESTDNPKTLMGDLFATLLGERVTFQGQRQLHVGAWTTLLVLAQIAHPNHQARLEYLQTTATQLKTHTDAANSRIGKVILDGFANEAELETKIKQYVDSAIERSVKHGSTFMP